MDWFALEQGLLIDLVFDLFVRTHFESNGDLVILLVHLILHVAHIDVMLTSSLECRLVYSEVVRVSAAKDLRRKEEKQADGCAEYGGEVVEEHVVAKLADAERV